MTLSIDIGKAQTIGITEEQLATMRGHEAVVNRVWRIGLKNILSDANASVKRDDFKTDEDYRAAALAASMKAFDALLAGQVRVAGAVRVSSDPVTAEAQRMARVKINGLAKGWEKDNAEALANIAAWAAKLGLPNATADDRKAIIAAAIAANAARADVIQAATESVAAKAKVVAAANVDDLL